MGMETKADFGAGISSYPVDSPLGPIVLEVGLFSVTVWEGFLRLDESMHTVDAIDLCEGVDEGIDEGHAAFLGEVITGGVIDLDHDLAVPSAEVFGRNIAGGGRFMILVDIVLLNGGIRVGNLDNSR